MPSKVKVSKQKAAIKQSEQPPVKRTASEAALDDIDDEEIDLAVETLRDIAQAMQSADNHEMTRNSKRLKPLRAAIFEVHRMTGHANTGSLVTRISDALVDARWIDARVLLSELRIRGEKIKLGTLQRWVREVDAASAALQNEQTTDEIYRTLDAILRATSQPARSLSNCSQKDEFSQIVQFTPAFSIGDCSGLKIRQEVLDGTIFSQSSLEIASHDIASWRERLELVETTPAAQRKPPNQYDAQIYTTKSPILQHVNTTITKHEVPGVAGAFVLENVLRPDECRHLISLGESVGFSPDCAVAGSAAQQASILAHNFYYLADPISLARLFERVKNLLPSEVEDCQLRGLNARFRVYRYVPGAVYRPHIDGSWPRSGLDKSKARGQQYIYDDQTEGAQLSRLTFLIYLNDEFEGGWTTFFVPNAIEGHMDAIRVVPQLGSILVFPHGASDGALLHEGSAVLAGAKYVIRTDVLYDRSDIVNQSTLAKLPEKVKTKTEDKIATLFRPAHTLGKHLQVASFSCSGSGRLCYLCPSSETTPHNPLYVISLSELPSTKCYDYDELMSAILDILETRHLYRSQELSCYELLVFCAGGKHRPSWPWLVQAFSRLDRTCRKDLRKLVLVHEKSWLRVCMQLLENTISPKFGRKVKHIQSLQQLRDLLGTRLESIPIPTAVLQYEDLLNSQASPRSKRNKTLPTVPQQPKQKKKPLPPAPRITPRASEVEPKVKTCPSPAIPPRRSMKEEFQPRIDIYQDASRPATATTWTSTSDSTLRTYSTGSRSTSDPVSEQYESLSLAHLTKSKHKGHGVLRRAMSGPLTPSSGTKQNYLPASSGGDMPPPKMTIQGRQVTIKTRHSEDGNSRVGGLKALFEERAAVVNNMA